MALSVLVASFGIFIAYKKYARFDLSKPEEEIGFIGKKFYVDEIYDSIFVQPTKALSTFIDKIVDFRTEFIYDRADSTDFDKISKNTSVTGDWASN